MIAGAGTGKKVEGDTHFPPAVEELPLVEVYDFLGASTFLLGFEGDWRAVLVGAGYHQDLITLQPMVSRKDIRR
jgi:hypothetical protein